MFIVEGNIGAGKTTFLRMIAEKDPSIQVQYEPLYAWQADGESESLLSLFYRNPQRWAYTLETVALACRVYHHREEQKNNYPYRLAERSLYSGHYVFAYNDWYSGFMNKLEWKAYNDLFHVLVKNCKAPLGFIYLKTDPATSYQRAKKRNRNAESALTLEYLQCVDQRHQSFLIEKNDVLPVLKGIPVLTLTVDNEFESNESQAHELVEKTISFMHAL